MIIESIKFFKKSDITHFFFTLFYAPFLCASILQEIKLVLKIKYMALPAKVKVISLQKMHRLTIEYHPDISEKYFSAFSCNFFFKSTKRNCVFLCISFYFIYHKMYHNIKCIILYDLKCIY